jgi:hypothetical protein
MNGSKQVTELRKIGNDSHFLVIQRFADEFARRPAIGKHNVVGPFVHGVLRETERH